MQQQGNKELCGIFCWGNVQLTVSIESMFKIVICNIGNKQCEELSFCGVVKVCF